MVDGALLLGLFTRPAASLLSCLLVFAYITDRASKCNAVVPPLNQNDPAVLFSFVLLLFAAVGANGGG